MTTSDDRNVPNSRTDSSPHQRRALVIAHEADGPGGQVATHLSQRGYTVDTHVVVPDPDHPNESVPFPDWSSYDVIVPMGSVRSVTEKDLISSWVHDELRLLRTAAATGQPVLGICFGGQLIAEALGGSVEVAPETEIGWFEIEPADGVENPVGPGPWLEWHHDRFEPPPGAQVLARSSVGPQLFRVDRIVGTQFHPEVDVAHLEHWLRGADPDYLDTHDVDAEALLTETRAREALAIENCRRLVDWFLDEVAFPPPPSPGVAS